MIARKKKKTWIKCKLINSKHPVVKVPQISKPIGKTFHRTPGQQDLWMTLNVAVTHQSESCRMLLWDNVNKCYILSSKLAKCAPLNKVIQV